MVESHLSYDLIPNIDQQAYNALAKRIIGALLQQPGMIEFRAHRSMTGSPEILTVTVWKTAADWARFAEDVYPPFLEEMRAFAVNFHFVLWGPSPVVPQPLRPTR